MELFGLDQDQLALALGAMKAVAVANGEYAEEERALLEAVAAALRYGGDVESLEPTGPAEVATGIDDEADRRRLVHSLLVTAAIDGSCTEDELLVVDRFAAALGQESPRARSLHLAAEAYVNVLRFDMARRIPALRQLGREGSLEEAPKGLLRFAGVLRGTLEDPDLAWRYRRLGLLPEGTLGRELWRYMTVRGFAFPGERLGMPERGLHHDVAHVLTGYDTDTAGEALLAAFYAGHLRADAFSLVFAALVALHLAIRFGASEPRPKKFDTRKIARAVERGAGVKVALTGPWTFWEVAELPLEKARERCGISAK